MKRVPIRDLETIVETLGDWAVHTKDLDVLTEYVRNALRRTLCSQLVEIDGEGRQRLYCVTLDPAVEDLIGGYIDRGPGGTSMSIPPQVANRVVRAVSEASQKLVDAGHALVIMTSPSVRAQVRQILDPHLTGVVVIAYNEVVKGLEVESLGLIQLPEEEMTPVGV